MGPFDDTKLQHFQTPLAGSGRLAHRNGIYFKVTQISQITQILIPLEYDSIKDNIYHIVN